MFSQFKEYLKKSATQKELDDIKSHLSLPKDGSEPLLANEKEEEKIKPTNELPDLKKWKKFCSRELNLVEKFKLIKEEFGVENMQLLAKLLQTDLVKGLHKG